MTLTKTGVKVASFGAVAALTLAACGGSNSTGTSSSSAAPAGNKGGTLNVLMIADFEHLDPQRNYVSDALNFGSRLLYRSLTGYKSVPGKAGSELEPDLATDLGKASNGNKTWEFTIRDGVKYQDGTDVTCADLKYGIERSFSDQITGGPSYAKDYLGGNSSTYKGPYVDKSADGLTSVTCDGKKVTFQLNRAIGDFNYTVSLPTFSPVPAAKDTNIKYDNVVWSTGPYQIQTYNRDKNMILVRNKSWDESTDPIRKAYPDTINVTFGIDGPTIDARLKADSGDDQSAVMLDSTIQGENLSAFLADPALKSRISSGFDGFVRYLAINTAKVTDVKVRQAIQLALNKKSYRGTRGGEQAGAYATSTITPALSSHKDFKDRATDNPEGDPAAATALLASDNVTAPVALKLDFANTATNAKSAAAFKEGLERVALFKVTLNAINPDVYYDTIGKTATQGDLSLAGWGPDWPSGSSVIPPLFDGRQIKPEGNQIFSQLNDPAVNSGIDAANAETDLTKQATMWGDLDQLVVVDKAAVIPLIYGTTNQMVGSKVKGAFLHAFYGEIDMATLSVA